MGFDNNEISANSKGGTELMRQGLEERIDKNLLNDFQIIPSRVRNLENDKIRVLWLHDLPGDPESNHLANGGHSRFHLLVFVSNWQMQQYINYYGIPWSKCVVIENAIEPFPSELTKSSELINIIYHTTPHRGLEILVPVFEKLCEKHDNIELNVYSSFKIYGWDQRDEQYKHVFEKCKNHPKINYHGTVSHEKVKEAVAKAHIFAYPSIWYETACISLMEAMSAQCVCIHPNLGALYETAGGMTMMYQWHENPTAHAEVFFRHLDAAISSFENEQIKVITKTQSSFINLRHDWRRIVMVWENALRNLLSQYPTNESRQLPQPMFHYRVQ